MNKAMRMFLQLKQSRAYAEIAIACESEAARQTPGGMGASDSLRHSTLRKWCDLVEKQAAALGGQLSAALDKRDSLLPSLPQRIRLPARVHPTVLEGDASSTAECAKCHRPPPFAAYRSGPASAPGYVLCQRLLPAQKKAQE